MNGHRRTGKPVFPKTRQIKKSPKSTPVRPTARRGMCEGGTVCGCPHRVKSGLGLPLCMRVYAPQGPPKKPANTHPAPPQGRGQCDGGTVCGCPHRVKSEVKPAAYAKVCVPRSPPIKKEPFGSFLFGGGEESRTPVRKPVRTAFYECSCSFNIPSVCRRTAGCRLQ